MLACLSKLWKTCIRLIRIVLNQLKFLISSLKILKHILRASVQIDNIRYNISNNIEIGAYEVMS